MDKAVKVLLIVFLSLLILGLIWIFTINIDIKIPKSKLIYDQNIEEEFNSITISNSSLDIKLIKSDVTNLKVYNNKETDIKVKVEDNTLKIDTEEDNHFCMFCFGKNELVLSLPENLYDLVINNKSGDINSKIDLNNATILSSSGDIFLPKANDLVVNITSGDLEVNEVKNIVINSSSGDIKINKIIDSVEIEATSGDINIEELSITKNSKIKVTSGDVTIHKSSNNIYYDAKATSGDIIIKDNDRHAEYEINITSKSGDIKVLDRYSINN